MKHTGKLKNKCAVVALTAALAVGGAAPAAAAESTYKDVEKAALKTLISGVKSNWDGYIENYKKSAEGSNVNLTLKAEDTGRALLSAMLSGTDMSWLQSVSLDMNMSIGDGAEAVLIALLLNDSNICSVNTYIDMNALTEYIQIPEFSESYLSAPVNVSAESSGVNVSEDTMETYLKVLADLTSVMPEADTVETLLDRYGNIIIDNMEEGSTTEQTLSVEGIEEECTVYEGILTDENVETMAKEILTAARDDEEIKSLFDQWAESGVSSEDQYEEFQASIDEILDAESSGEDTEAASTTPENLIFSEVWVNADGKIVGRQIGSGEVTVTWKNPSADGQSAVLLEIGGTDLQTVTFSGTGTTEDNILNGEYFIAVDGVKGINLAVENLETELGESGYYQNGTIQMTFPSGDTSSAESEVPAVTEESADAVGTEDSVSDSSAVSSDTNALESFTVDIVLTGDASAETQAIGLTLNTSGAALASLTVTSGYGDPVEIPDLSKLSPVYSSEETEDMNSYYAEINVDTILENLTNAGLPEEFTALAESTLNSLKTASESAEASDESTGIELTDDAA